MVDHVRQRDGVHETAKTPRPLVHDVQVGWQGSIMPEPCPIINVAGGGVVKYSKNKDNAIALLEFLTQPEAQILYSKMNYEYPVNPNVEPSEELSSWGVFIEDQLPVERLAELAPTAQKIIDRVGW